MKALEQLAIEDIQVELLYEASAVSDVLLSALKLCYERAAQVGYLNAGLTTDELILIEKAIKSADPTYRYKSIPTVVYDRKFVIQRIKDLRERHQISLGECVFFPAEIPER